MGMDVENPMVRPIVEKPCVGVAFCSNCLMRLFADEDFLDFEGNYLCDDQCLREFLGVKRIEGWELQ